MRAAAAHSSDQTTDSRASGRGAISVLIVDDDDGFRAGLGALLASYGFAVKGDASDGATAIARVREDPPDVVLMDLQMPRLSGLEATRAIAEAAPATAILVLTVSAEENDVINAIIGGACGYLVKGTSPEAVVAGVEAAARGESLISQEVAVRVFGRLRETVREKSPGDVPLSVLSAREVEILRLLARGHDNDDIADRLVISPFTVRNHVSNLLRKLRVQNRTQAATYAVRQGL